MISLFKRKDNLEPLNFPIYNLGYKFKIDGGVFEIVSYGRSLDKRWLYYLKNIISDSVRVFSEESLGNYERVEDVKIKIKESEDDNMSSNGELNKGINSELVQDYYRVTTNNIGQVKFSPITMLNLCFVKHDGIDKVYVFENKSDKRLKGGERVRVMTSRGETDATVVSSIKLPKKYLKQFMLAFVGKSTNYLMPIIGVYTDEVKVIKTLIKIGCDE